MALIARNVEYILLFVSLMIIGSTVAAYTNEDTLHIINVAVDGSNDSHVCPSKGNCSLMAGFRAAVNNEVFKSSTEIRIAPGNYELSERFSFVNFGNLTIGIAASGRINTARSVHIQCRGNSSGLSFHKCRNIEIRGISLASCGALYNSSSYNNPRFFSAVFVEDSRNFKLRTVAVRASLGVGVTMYDATGNVTVDSVVFENNGPNVTDCPNSGPKNTWESDQNIARAGGGLIIEFTYNNTKTNLSGGYFRIFHSKFAGNVAPSPNLRNETFSRPGGIKHIGFGRGGGLSVYLRGFAQKNTFWVDSCTFQDNIAVWGGGYFIQFLDHVQGNNFFILNTNATRNHACLGGGAFQVSGISNLGQSDFVPNDFQSTQCRFYSNSAVSGGGGTILGRTGISTEHNSYSFDKCIWARNEAAIGFAITLKLWDYDKGLFGPNSPFKVILSDCDVIENTMRGTDSQVSGLGALYVFLVPLFMKDVRFVQNTNTSLVLDTSSVTIMGNVTFSRNTGFKGGAVAMYGESCFNLTKGSQLMFVSNVAKEKGGAIFVESPGPDSIPQHAHNYLQTHECFFKYEDKNTHPNDWQAQVVFVENDAPPATGYSVFANTLQDCIYPGDSGVSTVLQWDSFHYYTSNSSNSSSKCGFEITTDAVKIHSKESEWIVPSDQKFSPQVVLLDEKNNSVYGMVDINIQSPEASPVTLGTPSSLFLVKDNIPFLDLKGSSGTKFSVKLRTVGGQLAQENLKNLTLRKCNPGFTQKGKECICLSHDGVAGISRCSKDGIHVYLEKGYWAGEVKGENEEMQFVTAQCPTGYCYCSQPPSISLSAGECVYNPSQMCDGNRVGVLCGACENGYDVQLGVQNCSAECDNSDLWRLAPLLLFLTCLVFFIFKINIDIFTCYMNAWLYFYQVINLITGVRGEVSLDPFIQFIIGLANMTISGFGSCMWKGMDNLGKLGFSYVLPVYVFFLILIIVLIAQKFPNSYFAKNSTFRASCTLFVLCYSTLTGVSLEILRPSKIGNTIVVFHQGTVKYFSSYHIAFAIPALLILFFVVIPFPIILMFTPFFIRHVKWVSYATPLFNTFQACFKDGYRWFAAFYFFCRFGFLLFATFIPYGELKAIVIQVACVLVLSIHVYFCPYLPEYGWINTLDSLLLVTLSVIGVIAGQMTRFISDGAKVNMVILINILAYVPLVYTVWLGLYHSYLFLKKKFRPTGTEFQNFSNVDDTNDSASVKVI